MRGEAHLGAASHDWSWLESLVCPADDDFVADSAELPPSPFRLDFDSFDVRFVLDTNAEIALLEGTPRSMARVRERVPFDLTILALATHERYFGALRHSGSEKTLTRVAERLEQPHVKFFNVVTVSA